MKFLLIPLVLILIIGGVLFLKPKGCPELTEEQTVVKLTEYLQALQTNQTPDFCTAELVKKLNEKG